METNTLIWAERVSGVRQGKFWACGHTIRAVGVGSEKYAREGEILSDIWF